jgi:hypothetical protein
MNEDHHLFIDGHSFRLADDVDLDELRKQLRQALEDRTVVTVPVVMDDTTGAVDLLLNGGCVRTAVVYRSRPPTTLGF